ncbi:hypothetical protein BH23ACT3_BH23ACT3_02810 [soil metagenome]
MTSTLETDTSTAPAVEPVKVVKIDRRTVDRILIGLGVVIAVVLAVAGGLLTWGASFSNDYVHDELSSQNIFFPPEEALLAEGRDDLVEYAGEQVTTGQHAEAYASFIDGHLPELTYAEQGAGERAARNAVAEAEEAGAPEAELQALRDEAAQLTQQRGTTFQGETLRGLLLSAYAWSTIGQISGLAAIAAFIGSVLMFVLVAMGLVHLRRHNRSHA